MSSPTQINWLCYDCRLGSKFSGSCAGGLVPDSCGDYYRPEPHRCRGGLSYDHPVTKDECYKCACTCRGCLTMAVAYGFADYEEVAHLIEEERQK